MDIEARLAAIEEKQNRILNLLANKEATIGKTMSLKEAAGYTGYSSDHFRRLAVEQHLIPFARPSQRQQGKQQQTRADRPPCRRDQIPQA